MQVVIALSAPDGIDRLNTRICGVPVLGRVITTALRNGATRFLILKPAGVPDEWVARHFGSRTDAPVRIRTLEVESPFDPGKPDDWQALAPHLDERFLWMPCDYLVHRAALAELLAVAADCPDSAVRFSGVSDEGRDRRIFERPTVLVKSDQLTGQVSEFQIATTQGQPGLVMRAPATPRDVERELVRHSGKATDGIYSRFNRRLSRPAVRWLSHTNVTPNAVSLTGLAVAVLAGFCFARGGWAFDVAGALLFFLSGIVDEMDGMLARLTFRESAFGCWLETMVDYATYLLVFAGMAAGGYRRAGSEYLILGALLLFGSVLSFIVISKQRVLAAPAGRPNEYCQRYLAALEHDAGNPVSRAVRQLHFLTKKGVLIHYILLFAILGLLPLCIVLATFGANAAWIATLYFNRRLFFAKGSRSTALSSEHAVPTQVEK